MRIVAELKDYFHTLQFLRRPRRWKPTALAAGLFVLAVGLFFVPSKQPKTDAPALPNGPTVGTEAATTILLDQRSYSVAELTSNTPLLVRIAGIEPKDDGVFAYHLVYTGLEIGVFNLTDFLVTTTGQRLREPIATVTIGSVIPPGARHAAVYTDPPYQGRAVPYKFLLILGTLVWAGCGGALFWPVKKQPAVTPDPEPEPQQDEPDAEESSAPKTLAELLRPLVEKAANKSISLEEKGRLEQILFEHWGKELELDHLDSLEQLRRILAHPDAGALLRTIERWLYQPNSLITPEEINAALQSYSALPSDPRQSTRPSRPKPTNQTAPTHFES
ncbi:MAG: hypothetical protein DVB28_001270 [Verrucomicrobia bacterium]|nr:MAG: hypothetical protein DVB28_001270 [Verrucomicrobiota bacterium]